MISWWFHVDFMMISCWFHDDFMLILARNGGVDGILPIVLVQKSRSGEWINLLMRKLSRYRLKLYRYVLAARLVPLLPLLISCHKLFGEYLLTYPTRLVFLMQAWEKIVFYLHFTAAQRPYSFSGDKQNNRLNDGFSKKLFFLFSFLSSLNSLILLHFNGRI